MAVFAVLDVLGAFSGFYPCCYYCFRRVAAVASSRSTHSRHRRCYECRQCRVTWEEGKLDYRYCLTLVARQISDDTHHCKDIVIFGKNLETIFGTPASTLHRFIRRFIIPGASPLIDPQTIYSIIAEPLRTLLLGRYFTAHIPQSTNQSNSAATGAGRRRYISTNFKLLGDLPYEGTVFSLLERQFIVQSPILAPAFSPSVGVMGLIENEGVNGSSMANSSSILSLVCSTAVESSMKVSLQSCSNTPENSGLKKDKRNPNSLNQRNICRSSPPPELSPVASTQVNPTVDFPTIYSQSTFSADFRELGYTWSDSQTNPSVNNKALLSTEIDGDWQEHKSFFVHEEERIMVEEKDLLVCEGILDELMASWTEKRCPTPVFGAPLQHENTVLTYEEVLPDSESFLEEFQCAFDQSSKSSFCEASGSISHSSPMPSQSPAKTANSSSRDYSASSIRPTQRSYVEQFSPELFSDSSCLHSYSGNPSQSSISSKNRTSPLSALCPHRSNPSVISSISCNRRASLSSYSSPSLTRPLQNRRSASFNSKDTSSFSPFLHQPSTTSSNRTKPSGRGPSPELFSSPRSSYSSSRLRREVSTQDEKVTPSVSGHLRQIAPKRRLLHPLLQHSMIYNTPTTPNDGSLSNCFSPELFP